MSVGATRVQHTPAPVPLEPPAAFTGTDMYRFGPEDPMPPDCPICGHLAMQHTRTPSGKRCVGNQWRCKCTERPLSTVITREMIEAAQSARYVKGRGV